MECLKAAPIAEDSEAPKQKVLLGQKRRTSQQQY